jgi:hypothetical protein
MTVRVGLVWLTTCCSTRLVQKQQNTVDQKLEQLSLRISILQKSFNVSFVRFLFFPLSYPSNFLAQGSIASTWLHSTRLTTPHHIHHTHHHLPPTPPPTHTHTTHQNTPPNHYTAPHITIHSHTAHHTLHHTPAHHTRTPHTASHIPPHHSTHTTTPHHHHTLHHTTHTTQFLKFCVDSEKENVFLPGPL